MSEAHHEQTILAAEDGHKIHLQSWTPASDPRGAIQLLHGLGEHIMRYERFAKAAVARGYVVYGHDHRGHGLSEGDRGYFADEDGWHKVIEDVRVVNEHIRDRHPAAPVIMLAHSMGSFIGEAFAMHYGARLQGLLLSGSSKPARLQVMPGRLLAKLESFRVGKRGNSALINALGFSAFNRPFRPVRTEMDWLSRDEAEVDRYLADPLCGGPFTCGLWLDFMAGLQELASDHAVTRIPADLPVLISGGSADPVGGEKGMTRLAMQYMQTLHQRVKLKIYPDGRHEMLNEVNRDDVTADWLDWIDEVSGSGQAG
jgi:alpha-beta hydrolase superfamily lysophospholipase